MLKKKVKKKQLTSSPIERKRPRKKRPPLKLRRSRSGLHIAKSPNPMTSSQDRKVVVKRRRTIKYMDVADGDLLMTGQRCTATSPANGGFHQVFNTAASVACHSNGREISFGYQAVIEFGLEQLLGSYFWITVSQFSSKQVNLLHIGAEFSVPTWHKRIGAVQLYKVIGGGCPFHRFKLAKLPSADRAGTREDMMDLFLRYPEMLDRQFRVYQNPDNSDHLFLFRDEAFVPSRETCLSQPAPVPRSRTQLLV